MLSWLVMTGFSLAVAAQSRTVSGTVTDNDSGETLPGVSVLVKGTATGTITDLEGRFSLNVTDGAVLVFTFVGFMNQEVPVAGQTQVDVQMEVDVMSLEEVVVIGYGVQAKKVVTAATVQVAGEKLEKRNVTGVMQALQGQAAGVTIRSSSGQPGEGMRVNIRGLGTTGNGGPLYIVDGIATGDISYLNNADIASLDVLKDAASAAIYGSRAANGVILITTKKGTGGNRTQISFDSYYGVQNAPKQIELLDARQYAQIMNEQHLNSGGTVNGLPFDLSNLPAYTGGTNANTDWLGRMFVNNAATQNYTVGLTNATDKSSYSASFSYTGQEGIVGGADYSNYERYNGRINTENKLYNGKLKVGENLTYAYVNRNGIAVGNQYSNSLRGAFNVSPLLPVYDANGEFLNTADANVRDQNGRNYWNNTESNPYAMMVINNQNDRNEQKLLANVYAELEPVKNLKINSSFGIDLHNDEYRSYSPEYQLSVYAIREISSVGQSMSRGRAFQWDNYASYDWNMGSHHLNTMLGMSSRDYQGAYIYGSNAHLIFPDFDRAWLSNASNIEAINLIQTSGAPFDRDKLLSYFGRLQYDFQQKYMVNAIFRADGSSRFAQGNRWGYFPSVSAGWVATDEGFLKANTVVNFLKVRASWGQNGNQSIPAFQYLAPISFTQAAYSFGNEEGMNTPGAYPSRLSYEQLKWETSEQLDFGFDLRTLGNRLAVTFDWYKKSTIDWLITAPVLATAGTAPPVINGGRVENTGVELELMFEERVGQLGISVSANANYNKNLVVEIPTEDETIHGAANTLYANSPEFYQARAGFPIGYFWGFQTDGLFQNTAEVQAHRNGEGRLIQANARPGDVRFVDLNDDGLLNDEDKVQLGNPNPVVTAGLNITLDFKGFDFSMMGYGAFGHQLVQSYRDHTGRYSNYTTDIMNRWTGEGTSDRIPRVTNGNINYIRFSDLFIQDGDFFRVGNITLGYDFAKLLDTKSIGKCRLYAAVNNALTFTKYTGMDPDIGYGFDNGIQDRFSSGIDLGFYPNPRTMMLGASITF